MTLCAWTLATAALIMIFTVARQVLLIDAAWQTLFSWGFYRFIYYELKLAGQIQLLSVEAKIRNLPGQGYSTKAGR